MTEAGRIELESETVKPFGTLKGKVFWQQSERPPSLELRVFWMTRGRGTEEVEVVSAVPGRLEADGSADFSIKLPGRPWSFDGQLISVSWAVELVDDQGEACGMANFVLSPDGEVRQLKKCRILRPRKLPSNLVRNECGNESFFHRPGGATAEVRSGVDWNLLGSD